MIKAVIFDMDGVLIDSEKEYLKINQLFLKESKVNLPIEELYFLAGSNSKVENAFYSKILNKPIEEVQKLSNAFYKSHPVDYKKIVKPFVYEILKWLKEKGIIIALASSSSLENINFVLKELNITHYFLLIVSGEMFEKSKPNPEIYEYTVSKLGIDKKDIMVVEDSTYGIKAAHCAGLRVSAVIDEVLNFDTSLAQYKIHSLEELVGIIGE